MQDYTVILLCCFLGIADGDFILYSVSVYLCSHEGYFRSLCTHLIMSVLFRIVLEFVCYFPHYSRVIFNCGLFVNSTHYTLLMIFGLVMFNGLERFKHYQSVGIRNPGRLYCR